MDLPPLWQSLCLVDAAHHGLGQVNDCLVVDGVAVALDFVLLEQLHKWLPPFRSLGKVRRLHDASQCAHVRAMNPRGIHLEADADRLTADGLKLGFRHG